MTDGSTPGLPPLAHGDDAKRAVGAARMLVDGITQLTSDVTVKVGVTSGRAFCGVVGSTERREYTVRLSVTHHGLFAV